MSKVRLVVAVVMSLFVLVGVVAAGGRPLSTMLTGAAEVPGPGDPDGEGTAMIRVNPGQEEICYELTAMGIDPARAAHIHVGAADVAGPVVVHLAPPVGDSSAASSSGCVSVDRELALAILKNPENYYVNVHNAMYPAGALRGQLSK